MNETEAKYILENTRGGGENNIEPYCGHDWIDYWHKRRRRTALGKWSNESCEYAYGDNNYYKNIFENLKKYPKILKNITYNFGVFQRELRGISIQNVCYKKCFF